MATIKTPQLFRCSISINGVTDLAAMNKYDIKYSGWDGMKELLAIRVGDVKSDAQLLAANSPALLADQIATPILLVGSTADDTVPISQARSMHSALKKSNKKVVYFELKDTGHNPFYYLEDQEQVFKEVESFLSEYLH